LWPIACRHILCCDSCLDTLCLLRFVLYVSLSFFSLSLWPFFLSVCLPISRLRVTDTTPPWIGNFSFFCLSLRMSICLDGWMGDCFLFEGREIGCEKQPVIGGLFFLPSFLPSFILPSCLPVCSSVYLAGLSQQKKAVNKKGTVRHSKRKREGLLAPCLPFFLCFLNVPEEKKTETNVWIDRHADFAFLSSMCA